MRDFMIAIAVATVLALAIYLTFTTTRWMNRGTGVHVWSTPTVVHQVQSLSDLVTVKYVMEKVEVLNDVKWYGESRVLLLAHGIVKAGINLKRLKPEDVTISGKTISLHLPPPEITDCYLDDSKTRVIDHTTGILRSFNKNLEQQARQDAVDDIEHAARNEGILNDANKRARMELKNFLKQAGFEEVEFR